MHGVNNPPFFWEEGMPKIGPPAMHSLPRYDVISLARGGMEAPNSILLLLRDEEEEVALLRLRA